jgi:hypothetical protein
VTGDIVTAPIVVAKRRGDNNVVRPTGAISKASRDGWIIETANDGIASVSRWLA